MTDTRRTQFTRLARLHAVGEPALISRLTLLGSRRERTLEGKLHGTWLTRPLPVAALYLLMATLGEVATIGRVATGSGWTPFLDSNAPIAITIHAAGLVLLITHAALVRRLSPELSRLLIAFTPIPILRIVSLTSPLAQFSYVQWFTVLAVILYSGIVTAVKLLKPDLASLGLRLPALRDVPLEVGVVLLGFAFGWLEYQILKPGPLAPSLAFKDLVAPVLILYIATGLLEELLFRGLLQKYAVDALGRVLGVVLVTLTFAVLHAGWQSGWDILFVGGVGLVYSLVILRTKSLLGVSVSHGVTNSMLFLVMPYLAR